jgi:hypothetical protein
MTKDKALRLALETLEGSRVFVMSREKIKQPEGANWYDDRITAIKEALAPTSLQMAAAELDDVELELLKAETAVEYANRVLVYNTARAMRLRAFIATQNRAEAEGGAT